MMRVPTPKRLGLVVVLGVALAFMLWMWGLYAFGEPPPVGLVVANETDEPLVVSLEGSDYRYPVSPEETEYIVLDATNDQGGFFLFVSSVFVDRSPSVPDHVGDVQIAEESGTAVWSGDLRDHPEFVGDRDWWVRVTDESGRIVVRPRDP